MLVPVSEHYDYLQQFVAGLQLQLEAAANYCDTHVGGRLGRAGPGGGCSSSAAYGMGGGASVARPGCSTRQPCG